MFFADTKLILTEIEKETVENVSTKLMKDTQNLPKELSVSLIFQYKKNKDVNNGIVLAPLFEFQISDLKPQYMDFKIQVHDNVLDAKKAYSESGYSADFQIENNNESKKHIFFSCLSSQSQTLQIEIDFDSPSSQTAEILLPYFTDIKIDDLQNSIKDVTKLVRRLFLQSTIDSSDVTKIIDSLKKTKLNEEILDTLLEGFREVTGERRLHLGNAFFVKDILHIILYSNKFEKLMIAKNLNLKVADFLTLHAKAFVQLKEEDKSDLFDPLKGKSVISKYRFFSVNELDEAKAEIIYELSKCNEFFNAQDLSTFQIKRLHTVVTQTCNSNNTYIDLGKELARKLDVTTFNQYVAVLEYGATLLDDKKREILKEDKSKTPDKIVTRRSKNQIKRELKKGTITLEEGNRLIKELTANSDLDSPNRVSKKDQLERAADIIRNDMDKLCKDFQNLAEQYENVFSKGQKYNFADPMLAAYHFVKHAKEYDKKYGSGSLTFEKYVTIARVMLSGNNIEFTWEQEGNVRRFQVKDEVETRTAIRRNDVIATLVFKLL